MPVGDIGSRPGRYGRPPVPGSAGITGMTATQPGYPGNPAGEYREEPSTGYWAAATPMSQAADSPSPGAVTGTGTN